MSEKKIDLESFLERVRARNEHEPEFLQAVEESARWLVPFVNERPAYREARLLERIVEPDRVLGFRVTWVDDGGEVQINRAWRVQFNNAVGPYKGGLRFHPTVTPSVLKFLGFEQVWKNSLTGLPLGGAKGGADFDPRGRSQAEVMRFCQALMGELHRYIGEDVDVPAGDIGVGQREIGYLFGHYRRLANRFAGVLTGKEPSFGGSCIRSEATGWGVAYFLARVLEDDLDGKSVAVSGSGNVALYAIEKLDELGATVVTASDSDGFVHDPDGIAGEKLAWLKELKQERRGRIRDYAEEFGVEFHEGGRPWAVDVDIAVPCATQNELDEDDARTLVGNNVVAVAEGANMPCTAAAKEVFRQAGVAHAPGKAANAGGVAVSALEQSQNAQRLAWTCEDVDARLQEIMAGIHEKCVEHGRTKERGVDYDQGATIAGFIRVADAMLAQGVV